MAASENASENANSSTTKSVHIIVIRLSAMGDVAMTVPVIGNLLQQYPDLKITVLTRKFFAPMFSSMKRVTIFEADIKGKHKGVSGLWRFYKALKKEQPDAIADLHNVLRSNVLKFFFSFTSIPFHQINKGRQEKRALTAVKNKVFKPLKSTHRRYADVFGRLGYPLELNISCAQPKRHLSQKVSEVTGDHQQQWIGIAPFAAYRSKMYPFQLMERVVEQLNNTNEYKIFLFGGGAEEIALLNGMEQRFSNTVAIPDKLKFDEELSLISHLDIMLSMDSGNGHLAAIFGIPIVTLWGVTHPYSGFSPFGQAPDNALLSDREKYPAIPTSVYGNKFPDGYQHAMASIAPETVVKKLTDILHQTIQ